MNIPLLEFLIGKTFERTGFKMITWVPRMKAMIQVKVSFLEEWYNNCCLLFGRLAVLGEECVGLVSGYTSKVRFKF